LKTTKGRIIFAPLSFGRFVVRILSALKKLK
jgi:hypothetical protein